MKFAISLAACTAAIFALAAGVESGLKRGDNLPAFDPTHVTGPDKGTDTCPVCKYGPTPAVQVWVADGNVDELAKIASTLETSIASAAKNGKQLKAFVVFVNGGCGNVNSCCATPDALKKTIETIAKKANVKEVSLVYVKSDDPSLKAYKINAEAKNTVFVYKNRKVVEKFVNLGADSKNLAALQTAIGNILN